MQAECTVEGGDRVEGPCHHRCCLYHFVVSPDKRYVLRVSSTGTLKHLAAHNTAQKTQRAQLLDQLRDMAEAEIPNGVKWMGHVRCVAETGRARHNIVNGLHGGVALKTVTASCTLHQ